MTRNYLTAAASAVALAFSSVGAAQAQSVSDVGRAAPALEQANGQLDEIDGTWIIGLVIVVAIGVGLYFVLSDDEATIPASP